MKTWITTISILTLLIGQTFSQETGNDSVFKFTVAEAQAFALENSNLIKNAKTEFQETKWKTREVMTEGLPVITSEVKYKNQYNILESVIPAGSFTGSLPPELLPPDFDPDSDVEIAFGVQHNASYDLVLNQLLIDGRYFIGLKANKALITVSNGKMELTEIEIKNVIASTYYGCLIANLYIQEVDSNIANIEKVFFETNELYKAGFSEELDVDRLQLNLSNLKSARIKAELQYNLSLNVLKYQMGLTKDDPIELTEDLNGLLNFGEDKSASPFDFKNRIEHKLLSTQLALRGYEISSVRAGYFPSLYFFTGYGFANQRGTFSDIFNEKWFSQGYFGFQLTVPIFDSYKRGTQVQQLKWQQAKIKNDLLNFQNQAELEVIQAKANYKSALEEYNNQNKNLELAKKINKKVIIKYKEGIGSSFELSESDRELTRAQSSFVDAVYQLLLKKLELEKALGEL